MIKLEEFLHNISEYRICLIANPGAITSSCHEFTRPMLCDCQILQLVEIIRIQNEALEKLKNGPGNPVGWKVTWAHNYAEKTQQKIEDLLSEAK